MQPGGQLSTQTPPGPYSLLAHLSCFKARPMAGVLQKPPVLTVRGRAGTDPACAHVCVRARLCACACMQVPTRVHVCIRVHVSICVCMHTVHMHVRSHAHMQLYARTCVCIHVRASVHVYVCVHVHVYVSVYVCIMCIRVLGTGLPTGRTMMSPSEDSAPTTRQDHGQPKA